MAKNKTKKDGKTYYRTNYRWVDADGTTHFTNTKWFPTKLEADQEAERLKKEKSLWDNGKNKKVIDAYDAFTTNVEQQAFNDKLKNKSSLISLHQRLKSIKKNYFPQELQKVKVKEVDASFFRKWLEYMDAQEIAGETIRSYKTVLNKFNKYLATNGYYENYNKDMEITIALNRVEIKPKKTGKRKRRTPTVADIEEIRRFYENDLGKFRNFYYYTFFYCEFYLGTRVSETIALKWADIDLRPEARVVYVRNAINGKEKRRIARKRTEVGNYSTKNETSERVVVIFDMIYQLLKDYKFRYRVHYKITEKEQEDCFVFPALTNPHNYASHNHLLEELKRACAGAGIEPLDNGMFRHGTCYFLVAPHPEGLGYSPEQVYSQMGHCDSSMINQVYSKLAKEQMARKNKITFNQIYHPEEDLKEKERNEELEWILKRVRGNNRAAEQVGKMYRFIMELERLGEGDTYYYNDEDEDTINQLKDAYPYINFSLLDAK